MNENEPIEHVIDKAIHNISRECRIFEGDSSYWIVDGKKYLTYEEAIKAIDEDFPRYLTEKVIIPDLIMDKAFLKALGVEYEYQF